jgi:FAD/FMN-containing dehydrogenase
MKTTLGGCLSANIHGKNNFQVGPIGEHVIEFTAMLSTGALITCAPKKKRGFVLRDDRRAGDARSLYFHHVTDETHLFRTCGCGRLARARISADT